MLGPADRRWDGRESVVAEWVLGDGCGPTILINDHMDTVGAGGMSVAPFDPVLKDGRIYGRGTSDTKGNLVAGLCAVAALLARPAGRRGRLVFASVVDEECNGGGAGTLACCLAGVRGDVALCLDGHREALHVGCNGVATGRVIVPGQAGHAAAGASVNAIDKGIVVKLALDAFGADYHARWPDCKYNLGIFRAGVLPSVVPGEAELQFNLSYAPEDAQAAERELGRWDAELVRRRVAAVLAAAAAADPWLAAHPPRLSWIKDLIPFLAAATHPFVQTVLAARREVLGQPAFPVKKMPAWFDAAHLARQLGVPTVGLGAATPGQAHAAGEYVDVAGLVQGAQSLALALHRWLGRDAQ